MTGVLIPIFLAEAGSEGSILHVFGVNWGGFISQAIIVTIVYLVLDKYAFGPIIVMLKERQQKVADSMANAEEIKRQLAATQSEVARLIASANDNSRQIIDEAKTGAAALSERKSQEAIRTAEQIIAKANVATVQERERVMSELKRELGRLVVDTTGKVLGRTLSEADRQRLNDEASRDIAA